MIDAYELVFAALAFGGLPLRLGFGLTVFDTVLSGTAVLASILVSSGIYI